MAMKKVIIWFLLLSPPYLLSAKMIDSEKTYVFLEELYFGKDQIWLKGSSDQAPIPVRSFHVDEGGYYIIPKEMNWICPKCGYDNDRPYPCYSCARCDWPYDGEVR